MPASQDDVDPMIGALIADRYEVTRRVARGSMGSVWAAMHRPLDREVAIKMLDVRSAHTVADSRSAGRDRKRFLREASLLSRLTHPHTVRVFDFGLHDDTPYIVMEMVKGDTLRHLLRKRGRLNPVRAVRLARQICGSLGEAHDLGLVHRDLKPANVLVSKDIDGDLVKVVDFGLVKEVRDAVHMTGDGMMIGTPMYMAPEQIRGHAVDQRCDLYALGVVLYRMLIGRTPFVEDQTAALLVAHITDPVPTFSEIDPDHGLPDCVEWTVRRCLEKSPDDRFASARELARALKLCEAALLDPSSLSTMELKLVDGRLDVPSGLLNTTSHEIIDLSTVRRLRMRRTLRTVGAIGGLVVAMLFALTFGFVVARGVLSFTGGGNPVPVAAPAPVVAPPTPAPAPAVVEDEPAPNADEAPAVEVDDPIAPVDVAPAPAPPVARPRPARPQPSPEPPPPAPVEAAPEAGVPAAVPVPPPEPAPEPDAIEGSDLVDPWSANGGN